MSNIPTEVKEFLLRNIRSIGQLEILLLMCSHLEREFSVSDVDRELKISPEWASRELEEFCSLGLLSKTGDREPTYRFEPRNLKEREVIIRLSKIYLEYRFSIINLIYTKPTEQVTEFAKAFKILRKEK